MFGKTRDHINNWKWNNPRAFRGQVDGSNPQTTCSGNIEHSVECFCWYSSDDLRETIQPPSRREYKPGSSLAVRLMHWDKIINKDDDVANCAGPGAPRSGSSLPGDGNYINDGEGEEDLQDGVKGPGKGKGRKDGIENGMGKETEEGKGKGNGTVNGIVKLTTGGDDISRAIALQLKKEIYEADTDKEG